MASNTTRAGLIKPTTLEPRAVGPLNSNADRTDELLGAFLINDGATIPDAQAIDGMIVKEKTSGKVWVLQKNVGGTFDKKYIVYPYTISAYSTSFGVGHNAWAQYSFTTWSPGVGVNSSAADIPAGKWVAPVTGTYVGYITAKWAANANFVRGINANINNTTPAEDNDRGDHVQGIAGVAVYTRTHIAQKFTAGDTLNANLFQNSGGTLNCDVLVLYLTLVSLA